MATTLSHFTLFEEVSSTADTVVHRALRNSDGAPVWIKSFRSGGSNPEDIARIKLEYAITRSLDIAGVVKAVGIYRFGDGLALVLEDFGGRGVRALLRRGRLQIATALWIASQVAGTLAPIHQQGMVHKRITPDSIIVNLEARRVGLSEFSAATRLSTEVTPQSALLDAPATMLPYLSPEQTGRVTRALDRRADLYSLGVTLFEMLTGALPFTAKDPLEIIYCTIARIPPSPREVTPEIPEIVAAIVMKLLAKEAEDRYQRASGLVADLEACLAALSEGSDVEPFPLARCDWSEFQIPQKLYGRRAEIEALLAAWDRAREGAVELVLIEGSPGTGKSALGAELRGAVARAHGYFVQARFEQTNHSAPYASLVLAFQGLLQQSLAESEGTFAHFRRDLSTAVGQSGQVLVDLLPELRRVLGPQPSAPVLGPVEAQNRLKLVFQSLLRVFTTPEHPVVIFLDDLRWADLASLKLLELLLMDPGGRHLLVICAAPDRLLDRSVAAILGAGVAVSRLELGPLSSADVEQLLADALSCDRERSQPLAELLFTTTRGTPLALHQRLEMLHDSALFSFDPSSGFLTWDVGRIEESLGTGNATALTEAKLERLGPATQRVLSLAACIGRNFDLHTLANLHGRPPGATANDLWDALELGLLVPLQGDYRLLQVAEEMADQTFEVTYEFAHDRVQQAADARLAAPERSAIHRQIGQLLRGQAARAGSDDVLFAIVHHEALGAPQITDRRERAEAAQRALLAGRRARARAAFRNAAGYFEAGSAFLDEASWEDTFELAFELVVEQAQCEHLASNIERAETLFKLAQSRARSDLDRAILARVRVILYAMAGKAADAVRIGQAALSLLGIRLPETDEEQRRAMETGLAEVTTNLGGRPVEALLSAPPMTHRR